MQIAIDADVFVIFGYILSIKVDFRFGDDDLVFKAASVVSVRSLLAYDIFAACSAFTARSCLNEKS